MRKRKKNVYKDLIFRGLYLKYELKKIILRSLKRSKTTTPIKVVYINYILSKFDKKASISRQYNPCLLMGRIGGVYKKYQFSRHMLLKLATRGNLQNTMIKSW